MAANSGTKSPTKGAGRSVSPLKKLNQTMSPSPRAVSKTPGADDFIKCDLCRQTLDDPRSLNCMHSYCKDCLMTYIMETIDDEKRQSERVIVCPVCLQKTSAPPGIDDTSKWADHIQPYDFLVSYLEASSLKNPHKKCDTCTRQNKRKEADEWCSTCHDALCDECVGFHNALKTTKGHKLTHLSKLKDQPIESIISSPLCSEHKGETVTNFCEEHSKIACKKCVAETHKSCKNVRTLAEAAAKRKGQISKTNDIIGEETKLAHGIHGNRVQEDSDVDEMQNTALVKIQNVKKKINENLVKCEQQIITELQEIHGKTKIDLQSEMKDAQRLRKASGKVHSLSTNTSKYGTDSHKIQMMHETTQQGEYYNQKLSSLNGRIKHTKIEFVVDSTLDRLMSGISKLGDIKITKSKAELPAPAILAMEQSNSDPEDEFDFYRSNRSRGQSPGSKAERRSLLSVKGSMKSVKFESPPLSASLVETISCNVSSDTESCWFTGIAYLHDDSIILVDRNNRKLKIVKDKKVEKVISLDNQPWGITLVGPTEVALTFPRQNRIAMYSLGASPTQTSSIQTSDRCYGITFANNTFAVTCACASPPSIKILTREGKETHSLSPTDNLHPMFFRPWYVKMDAKGTNIYISDCNRSHVTCITGKTMKRFKYEDISMNSPRGLYVLTDGRVIVCGFGTDNIQLLDPNGRLVDNLLNRNDDVIGPQDVTVNARGTVMAVTFDPSSGYSEVLKLYRLTQ